MNIRNIIVANNLSPLWNAHPENEKLLKNLFNIKIVVGVAIFGDYLRHTESLIVVKDYCFEFDKKFLKKSYYNILKNTACFNGFYYKLDILTLRYCSYSSFKKKINKGYHLLFF